MKILHINTHDVGGAGKACLRLHEGLIERGVFSKSLILSSKKNYSLEKNIEVFNTNSVSHKKQENIITRGLKELGICENENLKRQAIKAITPNPIETFTFPTSNYDITLHPAYTEADIIHLHWVSGFFDYSFFNKNTKPVVWTLHDMNPFTGGCHYSNNCEGYKTGCFNCPMLELINLSNYAHESFSYKRKNLTSKVPLHIVPLSKWINVCSSKSSLLGKYPHTIIPNGINSTVFKIYPPEESRKLFNLPLDKKVLSFVSQSIDNNRKGSSYIYESIKALKHIPDVIFCIIGKRSNKFNSDHVVQLGEIDDEDFMAKVYSACDALLLPSKEDNLPNTAIESLLCGTPVIGFNVGGIPDIINTGENGYLSEEINSTDFIVKIQHFLANGVSLTREKIRTRATESYDISTSVNKYITLYEEIIKPHQLIYS